VNATAREPPDSPGKPAPEAGPQADAKGSDISGALLELGQHLAGLRHDAGYTQVSFAAELRGYSRATIADAERGRRNLKRDFWLLCDELLQAGGQLTRAYDRMTVTAAASALQAAAKRAAADAPGGSRKLPKSAAVGTGSTPPALAAAVQHCPYCRCPLTVLSLVIGVPAADAVDGPAAESRPGVEPHE
jgi:DNA-binding XRE family transcriptional regulator